MADDDDIGPESAAATAEAEDAESRPPAHLITRVVSALILIPLALAAVWFGGIWFAALLGLAGLIMGIEWGMMITFSRREWIGYGGLVGVVAIGFVLSAGRAPDPLWIAAVVVLGLLFLFAGAIFKAARSRWLGVALIYCWVPVYALLWLRAFGGDDTGRWLVAWTLLVVWGTDIGGYFVGRTVGGAKLVPQISPNKTWSGLVGGMILAGIAGAVGAWWFRFDAILGPALAAMGLAVVGQMGDVVESAAKRHFGVKDSGRIIPGHGGVLDRVDGLVFVAPAVALAVKIGS